jgi:hypothetical protein
MIHLKNAHDYAVYMDKQLYSQAAPDKSEVSYKSPPSAIDRSPF